MDDTHDTQCLMSCTTSFGVFCLLGVIFAKSWVLGGGVLQLEKRWKVFRKKRLSEHEKFGFDCSTVRHPCC